MKSISELIIKKKGDTKIKSAHNEQIVEVMKLMGEDKSDSKRYRYWCGRVKHLSNEQIYRMRKEAQDYGDSPPKFFNYLLKASK